MKNDIKLINFEITKKYSLNLNVYNIYKIYFNEKSWNLLLFIFWKIQISSKENYKRKLIISIQSAMCSTSFVSVYWSWNRSYVTLGWISWKSMHFFAGPRFDLMSTKFVFYIVKGFGLIKRGMRVKRKCNHFKCNQGFSSKAACHEKKKRTCHQGIIKLVNSLLSCLSCQNHCLYSEKFK
jgi:hypothetical protein